MPKPRKKEELPEGFKRYKESVQQLAYSGADCSKLCQAAVLMEELVQGLEFAASTYKPLHPVVKALNPIHVALKHFKAWK